MPDELFRTMERVRKRRRVPRSRLVQEAVGDYVRRVDDEGDVEAYFESYRRMPDDDEDFRSAARAGIETLRRMKD